MSAPRLPIRLEKRLTTPWWMKVAVPVFSLGAALVAGAILLAATGHRPIDTYSKIVERAFTSEGAFTATLTAATPLLFTGLTAAVAFRMGIFNIGGQGQFVMGAIASSGVALLWGDSLGTWVIPLMIVAGMVAGAAVAAIPGFLKAFCSTNEIITSLMLNYIVANFAVYLIFNSESFWRLVTGTGKMFPQGRPIPVDAQWSPIGLSSFSIPLGFAIGTVVAVAIWWVYRRTRFGFEAAVIGDSPAAARYAGMRTRRKIMSVMALSGAMAGLGGASDIGDTRHVFDPKGLDQSLYGYAGIVVAALARLNPIAVVPVAIVMGGLDNAGRALQGADFPAGLVGTLQGLVLFFVLGGEVLARARIRRVRRTAEPGPGTAVSPGEPVVAS